MKVASVVARDVLKAGGIRLRSTKKGFGLGARILAVPEEEAGSRREPETGRRPGGS